MDTATGEGVEPSYNPSPGARTPAGVYTDPAVLEHRPPLP